MYIYIYIVSYQFSSAVVFVVSCDLYLGRTTRTCLSLILVVPLARVCIYIYIYIYISCVYLFLRFFLSLFACLFACLFVCVGVGVGFLSLDSSVACAYHWCVSS